jgi:hypothetical protein
MAERIAGPAREQLDPLIAQRQSEPAEAQAALEAGMVRRRSCARSGHRR